MFCARGALKRGSFNEAPARMRGKTTPANASRNWRTSFNEAPARMRGKTVMVLSRPSVFQGFNEAPARMRGKTTLARVERRRLDRLQ